MEALLNMRMLDTSYNRAGHIEELWREISGWTIKDFFVYQIRDMKAGKIFSRMADATDKVLNIAVVDKDYAKRFRAKCVVQQKLLDSVSYHGFPELKIAAKIEEGSSELFVSRKSLPSLPAIPALLDMSL